MLDNSRDTQTQTKGYPQSVIALVPKVGTGRAPSHAPASEEATDSNQAFALESTAESKMAEY